MMNKNRCTEFKKTNSIVYIIQRDLFLFQQLFLGQ